MWGSGPPLPLSIPALTPFPQPAQALPAGGLPPHPRARLHSTPIDSPDTSGPLVYPLWEGLELRAGWEGGHTKGGPGFNPRGLERTPGPSLLWLGNHRILGEKQRNRKKKKAIGTTSHAGERAGKPAVWESTSRRVPQPSLSEGEFGNVCQKV